MELSNNGIPIIGQQKIIVTMAHGRVANTFDVNIDTTTFQYGVPLAVQCLLQAAMSLLPQAYQIITESARREIE